MAVIIDENVSASLEEKLGANVWWKPDLDKKTLKSLCIKRSGPGILYVSLYFIALISMGYLAYITWGTYWSILFFGCTELFTHLVELTIMRRDTELFLKKED